MDDHGWSMVDHHFSNQIIYLFGVYMGILYPMSGNTLWLHFKYEVPFLKVYGFEVRQKDRPRQASSRFEGPAKIMTGFAIGPKCPPYYHQTQLNPINDTRRGYDRPWRYSRSSAILAICIMENVWKCDDWWILGVCPDYGQSIAYISSSYPVHHLHELFSLCHINTYIYYINLSWSP